MKAENLRINGIEIKGCYDICFNIYHKKVKEVKHNYKSVNLIGFFFCPNEIREVNLSNYFKIDELQLFVVTDWDIITISIIGGEINKYKFFEPFTLSGYGKKEVAYHTSIQYIV